MLILKNNPMADRPFHDKWSYFPTIKDDNDKFRGSTFIEDDL
jgi:hypothetical protein